MLHWIKYIALVFPLLGIALADELLVKTPSGPIRGRTTVGFSGKQVDVFYGIPYAKAPVGVLAFGAPIEVESWKDELKATEPSLACYQPSTVPNALLSDFTPKKPFSEDCLKLHIWVPKAARVNSTVMVYIHGGAFVNGHPLTPGLVGETLAAEENVIVVSMNYRLNMQGFLYLGIPEAPGNMGLMDQQMALSWIQRNIASFGGNPDDVTIFGMSAGGGSVGFQLFSPGSRNLFKRAILMSGIPNGVRSKEDVLESSMNLAKSFGCESSNPKEVLHCLQNKNPQSLSDWANKFSMLERQFLPTVDGTFLMDYPINLLKKKDVKYTDVMIGNTADEGSSFLQVTVPSIFLYPNGGISENEFFSSGDRIFMSHDNLTRKVAPLLYTDWTRPGDRYMWRDALIRLVSDYHFNCVADDFAALYSNTKSTIYRYVVDHHFQRLLFPEWMGTLHGIDSYLHLGMAARGGRKFTQNDVTLSRRVMRWFANFARTGNPNGLGQSGPMWDVATTTGKEYMHIAFESVMKKHFRTHECTMMKKIISVIDENQKHCHK